jgi:hypothetical protein
MNTAKNYVEYMNEVKELKFKLADAKAELGHYMKLARNNVTHSGIKGDGEYWTSWWVFVGNLSDEKLGECLYDLDIYEDRDRGVYDDNDWDCSGRTLRNKPKIKRTKTRILVTQTGYIDC